MIYQYIPHALTAMSKCTSEPFQECRSRKHSFHCRPTHVNALNAHGFYCWWMCSTVCCYYVSGGVAAYSSPEGSEPEQGLTDSSYDGRMEGDRLVAGLGRLTDGEFGADNFRLDTGYGKGMVLFGQRSPS